jgi:hypothetical protein
VPCTRSLGLLGSGLSPGKQEEHTLLILIVKGRAIRSLGRPRSCATIRFPGGGGRLDLRDGARKRTRENFAQEVHLTACATSHCPYRSCAQSLMLRA